MNSPEIDVSQASAIIDRIRQGARNPPPPPIDTPSRGGDNDGMEHRVKTLEDAMIQVRQDLAVMRSNYATRADLADVRGELKSDIANAKASIIMWVVGAIFLAQMLPALPAILRSLGLTS